MSKRHGILTLIRGILTAAQTGEIIPEVTDASERFGLYLSALSTMHNRKRIEGAILIYKYQGQSVKAVMWDGPEDSATKGILAGDEFFAVMQGVADKAAASAMGMALRGIKPASAPEPSIIVAAPECDCDGCKERRSFPS